MNGEVFACGPTAGSASCTIPLPEGTGTVNYLATSAQGTTAGGAKNWQRDVTLPVIDGTLNATAGANGWFISPAEVSASVTETGSGLGTFETSLDNTNWTAYTAPLTFNDGVYTLNLRATDIAGNIATADLAFNIDTLPPSVDGTLVGRLGSANWYISAVQASAAPADATSGVAFTEYSTDGGASWQPYAAPVNFNDGRHSIQFKTTDVAGLNALSPVYTFKADASAPHINLPSRWYIWESITFDLEEEMSGFADIEMQIMDSQRRWKKVEQHWQSDQSSFAHTLLWDRQFADGVLAPIGNYPVLVRAWDKAGNMSEKTGQIIIPQPEAAPLPTFTHTPTAVPEVMTMETEPPLDAEEAAATAIPEPVPAEDEKQPKARIVTFGSKSNTPTTPASRSPNSQSPILWGAAASAAIGAFNAAIEERKRRERAEHLRQLKNWEGNQSDYMRKRGAQKAVIAAWREKQKKKQAQKKKRLALQEKILGIKEKILDPIVPPPPNPYAGAADRIRAGANEIDDEKKIISYTPGSLVPTTSRLPLVAVTGSQSYPYRGNWYDLNKHDWRTNSYGTLPEWSSRQLFSDKIWQERGSKISQWSTNLQHGATFFSFLGGATETTRALLGGELGSVTGILGGALDGPLPVVELGAGLGGLIEGAKMGNNFHTMITDPIESRLSDASATTTYLSDIILGNTRIDIYDDHTSIVISDSTVTTIALAKIGGISKAGIFDFPIDLYGSAYVEEKAPGVYDLLGVTGNKIHILSSNSLDPFLPIQIPAEKPYSIYLQLGDK